MIFSVCVKNRFFTFSEDPPSKEDSINAIMQLFMLQVLLGILDKAYSMFCLFSGGVNHILDTKNDDREVLQDRVSHFFTRYLATLKLDQSGITDMWSGKGRVRF